MHYIDSISEEEDKQKIEEYYQRTVALKPLILANTEIMQTLADIFRVVYAGQTETQKRLLHLGEGNHHTVFGAGKIQTPHKTELHLSLRLKKQNPYKEDEGIAEEISAFVRALDYGHKMPYFVMAVSWQKNQIHSGDRLFAILSEDITKGKTLELGVEENGKFFSRKNPDGTIDKFFLDPPYKYETSPRLGLRYLSNETRIDLPSEP